MMSRRTRETAGSFQQQAVATANLLLEAANRLDGENPSGNVSEAAVTHSRSVRVVCHGLVATPGKIAVSH